jgi:hypothetical protein
MTLDLHLPEGYTFEEASPDVDVDRSQRGARTFTLAGDSDRQVVNPITLSISSRYIVSVALLATVLVLGALLRFPTLLVANQWRARRNRKRG